MKNYQNQLNLKGEDEMVKEKSAGAIIYHKNAEIKFLLLHYGAGHWDLAKGHVEEGETEEQTVSREVEEAIFEGVGRNAGLDIGGKVDEMKEVI